MRGQCRGRLVRQCGGGRAIAIAVVASVAALGGFPVSGALMVPSHAEAREQKAEKAVKPRSQKSAAASSPAARETAVSFEAVPYEALPGWSSDNHLAALEAFAKSCSRVVAAVRAGNKSGATPPPPELLSACADAAELMARKTTRAAARAFFESHFQPHRVLHARPTGMLTAYYEPVIRGSRTASKEFSAPVYRRPSDLLNLVSEGERGAKADQLTHARRKGTGWEPYPTRQEIEEGALAGRGLELLYLEDPVELFFMQVQGSGRIDFGDGTSMRVTYDGKNGHPYTSIGRYLIDNNLVPADRMSLAALKSWLRKHPARMREVLWQNKSYVFFRGLEDGEADGPLGVLSIPLTPGRSLAVDTAFHAIGTPVYVSSGALKHVTRDESGFHRLMIAQDVGSAIKGPERGDIYVGSGVKAGAIAGVTKHQGNFFVLLPKLLMADTRGTLVEATTPAAPAKKSERRQASQ